jgi:hypothetical protein
MKKKWTLLMFLLLLWCISGTVFADEIQVLPTDVEKSSEDCVFLGLEGKYITQIPEALDRINEIRYEACQEGVLNPSTNKPLTLSDYVPIRWSSDLEYIARIRAAESALTMAHERTNGTGCFKIKSSNGVGSYGEVIAWNWSETMIDGINQWYGEKEDWVEQNENAVTGHYTQMIDPTHLYIGMGTFCTKEALYYNTTVGEYTSESGLDETQGTGTGQIIQTLEIAKSYLNGIYQIVGTTTGQIGKSQSLKMMAGVTLLDSLDEDEEKADGLRVLDPISWSSSNESIVSVDKNGVATAKKCGTATITAKTETMEAKTSFTINHIEVTDPAVAATCTKTGLTKGSHCSVCGEVIKKQTSTPAIAHTWNDGKITKEATVDEKGEIVYTCRICGQTKKEILPKVKIKKGKTYTVNKIQYKVTNARTDGKGTVTLVGVTYSKASLQTLKIGNTVKIGGITFRIKEIGTAAFKGYKKLSTIVIGDNVEVIGKEAFANCIAVNKVTLGSSVTKINEKAFMGCKKLKNLTIKSKKLKAVGKNAIKTIATKAVIKVPASKVKAYKKLFKSSTGFKSTMKVKK